MLSVVRFLGFCIPYCVAQIVITIMLFSIASVCAESLVPNWEQQAVEDLNFILWVVAAVLAIPINVCLFRNYP